MSCHSPTVARHRIYPFVMALLVLFGLSGCGLGLSGPQRAAVKQVQAMVETEEAPAEWQPFLAHLPTRIVIEYAQALRKQGIALQYEVKAADNVDGSHARAIVNIARKTLQPIPERDHRLLVEMVRDKKGPWRVTSVSAL